MHNTDKNINTHRIQQFSHIIKSSPYNTEKKDSKKIVIEIYLKIYSSMLNPINI